MLNKIFFSIICNATVFAHCSVLFKPRWTTFMWSSEHTGSLYILRKTIWEASLLFYTVCVLHKWAASVFFELLLSIPFLSCMLWSVKLCLWWCPFFCRCLSSTFIPNDSELVFLVLEKYCVKSLTWCIDMENYFFKL